MSQFLMMSVLSLSIVSSAFAQERKVVSLEYVLKFADCSNGAECSFEMEDKGTEVQVDLDSQHVVAEEAPNSMGHFTTTLPITDELYAELSTFVVDYGSVEPIITLNVGMKNKNSTQENTFLCNAATPGQFNSDKNMERQLIVMCPYGDKLYGLVGIVRQK